MEMHENTLMLNIMSDMYPACLIDFISSESIVNREFLCTASKPHKIDARVIAADKMPVLQYRRICKHIHPYTRANVIRAIMNAIIKYVRVFMAFF